MLFAAHRQQYATEKSGWGVGTISQASNGRDSNGQNLVRSHVEIGYTYPSLAQVQNKKYTGSNMLR